MGKKKTRHNYRSLPVNQHIRDLELQLNAEHAQAGCFSGYCEHGTPVPALPKGVIAIVTIDWAKRDPRAFRVTLVRYRKGLGDRWNVVRADNERKLGWVHKTLYGEHAGSWTVHIAESAFRGTGTDDEGDILDAVPAWLYNGDGEGGSRSLTREETRFWAARAIVSHLLNEGAAALSGTAHPNVRVTKTRVHQHFPLGEGANEHCSCGHDVDCPERQRLIAADAYY